MKNKKSTNFETTKTFAILMGSFVNFLIWVKKKIHLKKKKKLINYCFKRLPSSLVFS